VGDAGVAAEIFPDKTAWPSSTLEGTAETNSSCRRRRSDPNCPPKVMLITSPENHRATIHQRLRSAGADLDRVIVIQTVYDLDIPKEQVTPYRIELPRNTLEIERMLMGDESIHMIVFDSFANLIRGAQGVRLRELIHDIESMAQRFDVAAVIVQPLKGLARWGKELQQLGPAAFLEIPRTIWGIGRKTPDPNSPRVMYPLKLADCEFGVQQEFTIQQGRVHWSDAEVRASAIRQADPQGFAEDRVSMFDRTLDRLVELLEQGPRLAVDLRTILEREGLSWRTCERVKRELRIVSQVMKVDEPGIKRRWAWSLPVDLEQGSEPLPPRNGLELAEYAMRMQQEMLDNLGPGGLPKEMLGADGLPSPEAQEASGKRKGKKKRRRNRNPKYKNEELVALLGAGTPGFLVQSMVDRLSRGLSEKEIDDFARWWSAVDRDEFWMNPDLNALPVIPGAVNDPKAGRYAGGSLSKGSGGLRGVGLTPGEKKPFWKVQTKKPRTEAPPSEPPQSGK